MIAAPAPVTKQQVEDVFSSLNLYLEMIAHGDACFHRSNMRLVRALDHRISEIQARAKAEFHGIDLTAGSGETDYLCARQSGESPRISLRAIHAELDRLVRAAESLLP